jgi:hypothetical protein
MKCTLVLAFIAVCVCTTLAADIIQASRDVTIFQNPATNANSKGSFMHVGGATGSRRRSIINFDVTALTADPTEVILNLYMADFSAAAAGSVKVNIYPMNSAPAWHEGSAAAEDAATIGIPAGPEDPTWTQASYPGISWGIGTCWVCGMACAPDINGRTFAVGLGCVPRSCCPFVLQYNRWWIV